LQFSSFFPPSSPPLFPPSPILEKRWKHPSRQKSKKRKKGKKKDEKENKMNKKAPPPPVEKANPGKRKPVEKNPLSLPPFPKTNPRKKRGNKLKKK
jgi:hypothetical protein